MTLVLASAWRPRGELSRFQILLPRLQQAYTDLVISLPPDAEGDVLDSLQSLPHVEVVITPDWSFGRHLALQVALKYEVTHVHYADFDRLLRWIETRPEEWQATLAAIQETDCLVIGRTEAAYRTHPLALVATEAISNLVTSYLLGQTMDVSAGSKGFSRQAVEFLMAHCQPGRALGTDADWLVTLHQGGFRINYLKVDGLDWESADRFQAQAADDQDQRRLAAAYDLDPQHWAQRVGVALEIVQSGLEAESKEVESTKDTKFTNEERENYLISKDEVYAIVGAAIEVHRQLGPGFLEAVYQEALQIELKIRSIPFEIHGELPVYYKGYLLDKAYLADLICYGQILVELKALSALSGNEEAQVLNYLKATGIKVGLLINFGSFGRLEWKRFVK